MSNIKIDQEKFTDALRRYFPNRVHAQAKHISEIIDELSKEGINSIESFEDLLTKYPPDRYAPKLENEIGFRLSDIGVIRSLLVAMKIDEIKSVIDEWGPLPIEPKRIQDSAPFVNIGNGVASYLMKSGNRIKILATNEGELEISYDELGNRIGTGLPYLRRLAGRLEVFKEILSAEMKAEA